MNMPKRIFAWAYHPDNAKNRAQGAWDTREGERSASDVDFVRDDIVRGLAEALRPFARASMFAGPQHDFVTVPLADCDRARAALAAYGGGVR